MAELAGMPWWHLLLAALLAPAAVWVLWRLQTLSVELLRLRMLKLTLRRDQRWIYATVSWFGVLLHEASHAIVLLLSGHGIREFRVRSESGHVLPSRNPRTAVGFFGFLLAALAPLFIPPALALAALWATAGFEQPPITWPGVGLEPAFGALRDTLLAFPLSLGATLLHLDLAQWPQAAAFALAILAMPSSRPSHVKGSRFHGTKDEGDVAVLRARIREQPLLFLAFLVALAAAYAIVLVLPAAYWLPIQAVWAIAVTGIVLALLGALWWSLAALGGRTLALLAPLGFAAFLAVQAVPRLVAVPLLDTPATINVASLAAWAATSLLLAAVAPRRF